MQHLNVHNTSQTDSEPSRSRRRTLRPYVFRIHTCKRSSRRRTRWWYLGTGSDKKAHSEDASACTDQTVRPINQPARKIWHCSDLLGSNKNTRSMPWMAQLATKTVVPAWQACRRSTETLYLTGGSKILQQELHDRATTRASPRLIIASGSTMMPA